MRAAYEPPDPVEVDGRVPHVVLVGKGITFDSGGLSLKTADGMTTMKTDMSGAAIVLAALSACADLGGAGPGDARSPRSPRTCPAAGAIKPGDVLTIRNGSTIEVLNTDAEGRLVLADALSLAAEMSARRHRRRGHPDRGGRRGPRRRGIAPLFGNDDELVERVRRRRGRGGRAAVADARCPRSTPTTSTPRWPT